MLNQKPRPGTDSSLPQSEGKKSAKPGETAKKALLEAKARRELIDKKTARTKEEQGGRGGLEPTRYDDWEINGIASDF